MFFNFSAYFELKQDFSIYSSTLYDNNQTKSNVL